MGAYVIILSHLFSRDNTLIFNINLKNMSKRPRMHTNTHIYVCFYTYMSAYMHVFGKQMIQILFQIQYDIHLFIILFCNQFNLAPEAMLHMTFINIIPPIGDTTDILEQYCFS